jgi:acetyl-CoA acetyltransferase
VLDRSGVDPALVGQVIGGTTALVGAGLTDVALACGTESMTRIPIGANYGEQLGLGRPVPKAYQRHYEFLNQFKRHYEFLNQFKFAERIAECYGITCDRAGAFGLASRQRAAAAWAQGRFDGEVVTGPVEADDGEASWLAKDEGLHEHAGTSSPDSSRCFPTVSTRRAPARRGLAAGRRGPVDDAARPARRGAGPARAQPPGPG